MEKAQLLKQRGYVVLPDPCDPVRVKEYQKGIFTEFERYSRIGMVGRESFVSRAKE